MDSPETIFSSNVCTDESCNFINRTLRCVLISFGVFITIRLDIVFVLLGLSNDGLVTWLLMNMEVVQMFH